jgi:hypothetical protein
MQIKTLVFFDMQTILLLMQKDQIENDHDDFNSGGWEDIANICYCEAKELSKRVDDRRTHHQVGDRSLGQKTGCFSE